MRRSLLLLSTAVLLVAVCVGCPWNPRSYTFTSANLSSSHRNGLFDMAEGTYSPTTNDTTGTSETQRQVVEPDVIRRDGQYLYILNQYRGLTIVDLASQQLLAQVPTYGFPRDLYIVGNRAYVLVGYAAQYEQTGTEIKATISSRVYAADISVPAQSQIVGTFDLEGDFIDSRLVGDVLYAVSARYQWYWTEDTVTAVEKQESSDSWVTSLNVADPANLAIVDTLSLSGYGNLIQATNTAIFVASSNWINDVTHITYVDIADPAGAIATRGAVDVPGYIADRYKMDAYNGVLRVVSNTSWQHREVYITTVDLANPDAPAILASVPIEGAAGETAFATRFDGPRAYVVSYLVVDPLFVLDLSNPAAPALLGALEVPGWSTHIEPRGDRLIALGVDDTNGRRVCVSLFDVEDPAHLGLIDRVTFGENWSWSSAYSDVKAFTVLDDMLLVPFSGWTDSGGFERLQLVSYSRDGLNARGYVDLQGQTLRSFEYQDAYYAVTTEQLVTIDASNPDAPEATHRLTLAEYVADYLELSPELGAAIISQFDTEKTIVRTETLTGEALGEIETSIRSLTAVHPHGQSVVLVGTGYTSYKGFYQVVLVDCSTPETPTVSADFKIDVQPYWGGYWYYDVLPMGGVVDAVAAREKSQEKARYYMPWYWWPVGDTTFVTGDTLTLRCSADAYDITFGTSNPSQGVALVDLNTATLKHTVGLGYDWVDSIHQSGDMLYLSTKKSAGSDLRGRQYVAYFISAFTPSVPTMGPLANVPGSFVQYDAASGVLVLEDSQFTGGWDWSFTRSIHSVQWTGGEQVTPIDELDLLSDAGTLTGRGAHIYYTGYDNGYKLSAVNVSASGEVAFGKSVNVSSDWVYLVDATANSVFLTVGGGAVARYDFSGTPSLTDLQPVMSTPQKIRFGQTTAYAPLGYAGLLSLPK